VQLLGRAGPAAAVTESHITLPTGTELLSVTVWADSM
jgi:hypothetical protein